MIVLKNISKSFGQNIVLKNISLEIREGERLCIIGKSGCGKTVLLKHLVGLLKSDSGEIWIDGMNTTGFPDEKWYQILPRFGVVFQGGALFDSMSVEENVGLALSEHKIAAKEKIREEVTRALSRVALTNIHQEKPSSLSGGMKKRVSIARALIHNPKYIIYDEPTTGLDPLTSETIDDLILEISHMQGTTSVVVTHDLLTVKKVAERIIFLSGGEICFEGTYRNLEESKDTVIREFIQRETSRW